MIDYIKCECTKYAVPEEDSEPPISVSANAQNTLVAVVKNKRYVHVSKITGGKLAPCKAIFLGNRHKIVALEWSSQNDLLVLTIDMKCVIYKKGKNERWETTNVGITAEELLPTCACWHPHAHSFAIGFSSGVIFICSKGEDTNWKIEKLANHSGSVLFLQWSYSGHILCSCSMDSSAQLVCTSGAFRTLDEGIPDEGRTRTLPSIDELIEDRDLKRNDVIGKIECEGHVILHSSFSPSSKRVAVIASSFDDNRENQQIIICDYLKSAPNTQFVAWVGQTMQKCLFLDEDTLLVYGYEVFPILVECLSGEWTLSKVVLPQFSIKNLSIDFFYDKKGIQDIEDQCQHMSGNEIIGEIVAHSNNILQMCLLEPREGQEYAQFVTVSSDFNVVFWRFPCDSVERVGKPFLAS
ncbi:WD domain, G-beta repeat domain containing protein [Plasmodium vivax]|uniref:Arp2/3 complex 41 kDa subunit n=1 Tax=Plasmodium vivax (strain Salvador I) TaxID=126793 RepID=A5K4K1_PLAVS|nr:WD domain, G-beta repeat domain containing protein [Plasmodium vivax]EDL45579.1 WD domain, G-beta repeat domain containing protein [Plasmodium vivax]|eukprot:XP_001615306.1 WD domain, G-beta repeat domain containing protein [Plasmodium vivax Sal-1]